MVQATEERRSPWQRTPSGHSPVNQQRREESRGQCTTSGRSFNSTHFGCAPTTGKPCLERLVPIHHFFGQVRGSKSGANHFVRIPRGALLLPKDHLGHQALRLYALIVDHINWNNTNSICFLSDKHLLDELGVNKKTLLRARKNLEEIGLVRVFEKDGKTHYEVFAPVVPADKSAPSTGQVCDRQRTGLSARQRGRVSQNDALKGTSSHTPGSLIEPLNRTLEKGEVQDCTSPSTRLELQHLGFSKANASELIEEFGESRVMDGIAHVRKKENVRNPAGLLVEFLKTNGWTLEDRVKDFLLKMPDPRTTSERRDIANRLVQIAGSKRKALEVLGRVKEDGHNLERSATKEAQIQIGRKYVSRSSDATHFVKTLTESPEEQRASAEFLKAFRKYRREHIEESAPVAD